MTQRDDGHDYRDSKNKAEYYEKQKIKKLLGLNGDETDEKKYYNVTDVLIALMHFCDQNKNEYNWDFETHLERAREGYREENN